MLQFLIVLFVAPRPVPKLAREITVGLAVFVFVMVRLRSVPVPSSEPSRVTLSAPLRRMSAPAMFPLMTRAAPVGKILSEGDVPISAFKATVPVSAVRSVRELNVHCSVHPLLLIASNKPPTFVRLV